MINGLWGYPEHTILKCRQPTSRPADVVYLGARLELNDLFLQDHGTFLRLYLYYLVPKHG